MNVVVLGIHELVPPIGRHCVSSRNPTRDYGIKLQPKVFMMEQTMAMNGFEMRIIQLYY